MRILAACFAANMLASCTADKVAPPDENGKVVHMETPEPVSPPPASGNDTSRQTTYDAASDIAFEPVTGRDGRRGWGTSGITEPEFRRIRDAGDWQAAWKRIHQGQTPQPPLSQKDFKQDMIILLATGGMSGVGVRIDRIEQVEGRWIVHATKIMPHRDCPPPPIPFHPVDAVVAPKNHSAALSLVMREATPPCE